MKIAAIMLAAGTSSRFGSNKLLYEIEGRPMYAHTLDMLCEAAEGNLTVVTRQECGEIAGAAQKAGARVLYNPNPQEGIASSLKIGLRANLEADACLFAVSDQPWMKTDTVKELIRLFKSSGKGMACVSFEGKTGNPCIFSRKYYQALLSLTGDRGGKRVIDAKREDTAFLSVENLRELADIDKISDTPASSGV